MITHFPYPVLYESPRIVVIDKPAGLPVHPGPKAGHSVEALFSLLTRRKEGPWLVHRLDTDTSGCLMIALRKQALVEAQALFASGQVAKTYWAVVENSPDKPEGVINIPLRKTSTPQGWKMESHPEGQEARTAWRVLAQSKGKTLLGLRLMTGRTHQARVHCALMNCPILGDTRYGGGTGPLHLMSRALEAKMSKELVSACAAPPAHLYRTCQDYGLLLP